MHGNKHTHSIIGDVPESIHPWKKAIKKLLLAYGLIDSTFTGEVTLFICKGGVSKLRKVKELG